MLNIDLNQFLRINRNLADYCVSRKVKRIIISLPDDQGEELYSAETVRIIYDFLDQEHLFEIWLKNFPYCLFENDVFDHILPAEKKKSRKKITACRQCKYNNICIGFSTHLIKKLGADIIKPIPDIPVEIMIEVESRCNFQCNFCFNEIAFAKHGRIAKPLPKAVIKKIIDNIKRAGIKSVRFTGGEPLLRPDFFELCRYAKKKNLEVRLNTNGSLVTAENAKQIAEYVDNVLLPIESATEAEEDEITNYKNALKKKINAARLLKKHKTKVVRIGTIATGKNVNDFDALAKIISSLPIDEWEFYRPVCHDQDGLKEVKNDSIAKLTDHIMRLRPKTEIKIGIASTLPLCCIKNVNGLNSVYAGSIYDEGQSRMVIDPRGYIKPHYFLDKKIGNAPDIIQAWNNPYMKKIRNLSFLPPECKTCRFKAKCRGGSRYHGMLATGKIDGLDPLADLGNIGQ